MEQAPITSAGIAGNVVIEMGPTTAICLDFVESIGAGVGGRAVRLQDHVDRRLDHDGWSTSTSRTGSTHCSCRAASAPSRPGPFNEYVMTFFKALGPNGSTTSSRATAQARRADEFFERDGWRIERWCPHRQADLTRFGEISDGVLTCSLHHWQFDLDPGRCLTSDDRHLRCERVRQTDSALACEAAAVGRVAFNHVGQCVTDLERSKRFYVELLGSPRPRDPSAPTTSRPA